MLSDCSLFCSLFSGALAVAYHNIGVEQEYLKEYADCLENYEKAVEVAIKELGATDAITLMLSQSLRQAQKVLNKM